MYLATGALGDTVAASAMGSGGKSVGDGISSVDTSIEDSANSASQSLEIVGQWKQQT